MELRGEGSVRPHEQGRSRARCELHHALDKSAEASSILHFPMILLSRT